MKKDVEKNRNVRNRFYASSPPRVGFCVLQKKGQTKLKRAAFSISPPPLVTGDGAYGRERRVRNCKRASFADVAPREIKP